MNDDRSLTCERLAESLDDYLDLPSAALANEDGHPTSPTRSAIEGHLAACPTCTALVADVGAIRRSARALEPIEPPAHVWTQLQARLTPDQREPASSPVARFFAGLAGWGAVQPLGAVAGLVLIVSSLAWVGTRLAVAPTPVADGSGAPVEFQLAEAEYTEAIARLQEAADAAGPKLDALTNATLRSSIDDIDSAIDDAREALAQAPGDTLSQESLLDALGSKVALLQDTVTLAGDIGPGTEVQNP